MTRFCRFISDSKIGWHSLCCSDRGPNLVRCYLVTNVRCSLTAEAQSLALLIFLTNAESTCHVALPSFPGCSNRCRASQTNARADFTIQVIPSIGINATDAPFLNASGPSGYYTNALNSLAAVYNPGMYGGGSPLIAGASNTPGTPGYYSALSPGAKVPASSLSTTGFNSWMAIAPPSGNYSGQYGNSLYFGLVIKPTGPSTSFTLSALNSANTTTNTNLQGDLVFNGYSPSAKIYVATSPGGALVPSTSVTSSTPIYGLVSVGSADSIQVDYYNASNTPSLVGASQQAVINYNLLQFGIGSYPYNEAYSIPGFSGNVSLDIQGVPEPATWTLLGVGAVGLMLRRRFARAKAAA